MAKRKPVAVRMNEMKTDGWNNLFTKLGFSSRDKLTGGYVESPGLTWKSRQLLYRYDDMAARGVDLLPFEAMREGYEIRVTDNEKLSEDLEKEHERLYVAEKIKQALTWERLYGGAVILLGVNDGQKDLSKPLDTARVVSLDYLTVFTPPEVQVVDWNRNPVAADYGTPMYYHIMPRSMGFSVGPSLNRVHASRVVHLGGIQTDREQMLEMTGFGDSVLDRPYNIIRNYGLSWGSVAHLLQDFAQAIFKVSGLADAMASDKEGLIAARMSAIDMSRSSMRAVLLDAGTEGGVGAEEFERKTTPVSGLPELLQQLSIRLAAAFNMPVTLLMGQSPAGLNATGAADVAFWYNSVKAYQNSTVKCALDKITDLIMLTKKGPTRGKEVEYSIQFRPLFQPTELEQADTRLKMSQVDSAYIDMGVATPDEIRAARFGGDRYSIELSVEGDLGLDPFDGSMQAPVQVDPNKTPVEPVEPVEPKGE
jgi:hypothetical protein